MEVAGDVLLAQVNLELEYSPECIYLGRDSLGTHFPMHNHNKSQLLIVENGVAHLKTENLNFYIPARHYVWIPRNTDHYIDFKSSAVVIKAIYFNDENDLDHRYYGKSGIYLLTSPLLEMIEFTKDWYGNIELSDWRHEYLLTLKHLLPQLTQKPLQLKLPTTNNEHLLLLLLYLNEHLNEGLLITAVATKFGFSIRNLSRTFERELKMSYTQYLKNLRIIKAMDLLLTSSLNVSEVADLVGYSSISAFSNSFQDILNMRPKEFQQLSLR